jgi:hypothetical protein
MASMEFAEGENTAGRIHRASLHLTRAPVSVTIYTRLFYE